jgi:hypothetical protein
VEHQEVYLLVENAGMKIHNHSLALVVIVTLCGCSGTNPTRLLGNSAAATGGALIGDALSDGDPLFAGIGAGAGVLLSETLQAGSSSARQKSYAAGYEKGRSDAAKQHYQALIDEQRPGSDSASASVSLYEFPLPEREVDGAILAPSTRVLRIAE